MEIHVLPARQALPLGHEGRVNGHSEGIYGASADFSNSEIFDGAAPMLNLLLVHLAGAAGFIISFYFLFVFKGWLAPNELLLPQSICSEKECSTVVHSPFGHALFGIPNFYFGMAYYLILVLSPQEWIIEWRPAYLLLSWLVVFFSMYLAWALIFKLKANCVLCFASHLLNVVIVVALTGD